MWEIIGQHETGPTSSHVLGLYIDFETYLYRLIGDKNSYEITAKLNTFIKTKHWNIYELWSIALSGDIDKNDRYTFIYIIHWCMWLIISYLMRLRNDH